MIATRPNAMRGDFEIVDRLQDRLVDQPHDLAELRRQQPLGGRAHRGDRLAPDQRRRDRDRMRRAALVGEQLPQLGRLVGRPVPDHVVAAVAGPQIVVRAGHRIAQELLARRQAERHVLEQLAMDVAAGTPPRGSARARPHSRHRAAPAPAGIAGGWSSGCRRRRPADRPRRCCRRRSARSPPRAGLRRSARRPARGGNARGGNASRSTR